TSSYMLCPNTKFLTVSARRRARDVKKFTPTLQLSPIYTVEPFDEYQYRVAKNTVRNSEAFRSRLDNV
ncbi:hypothetical protein RYB05_02360, partial [Pseudomonas syringae pv. actinidiae]|nr:hypothetical protein [Pseudomonas syringae pv. actinidiae]